LPKIIPLPPFDRLNTLLRVVEIQPSQFGIRSGLVWRVRRGGKALAGSVAGTLAPHSVQCSRLDWYIRIDKKTYSVPRIIYFMMSNNDPGTLQVDHKDKNSLNNNYDNLCLIDKFVHAHDRGMLINNTSGATGVWWDKCRKKWCVQLRYKNNIICLGYYFCKLEAAQVYNSKILELELDKIGKPLNDLNVIECSCSTSHRSLLISYAKVSLK
jgi:hypothetical protein